MLTTVCNVILACKHLWQLWRGAPATMGCPAVPHLRLTPENCICPCCVCVILLQPYHQQYLSRGGRFNQPQDASKGCNGEAHTTPHLHTTAGTASFNQYSTAQSRNSRSVVFCTSKAVCA